MKTILILIACGLAWLEWDYQPHLVANVDAVVFAPPLLDGNGFRPWYNPVWPSALRLDRSGEGRYVYHGPLYPTFAWFMGRPANGVELVNSIAVRRALLPLAWIGVFLLLALRVGQPIDRRLGWVAVPCQILAFFVFARDWGRPEDLATLVLLLGAGAVILSPPRLRLAIGSITIAWVAGISPWNGVGAGLLLAAAVAVAFPAREAIPRIALAAVAAVAIFFASMKLLYPFPIREWWYATGRMTRTASGIPVRWTLTPNALSIGWWMIVAGCFVLFGWGYLRRRAAWPMGVVGLVLLLIAVNWWQAVAKLRPHYAATLAVIFFLVLPFVLVRVRVLSTGNPYWRLSTTGCFCIFLMYATGEFVRLLTIRLTGDDVGSVVARFDSLVRPGETVSLPYRFFYVASPARGRPASVADVIVLRQESDSSGRPPEMPGFECVWNNFTSVGPWRWMQVNYFPMNRWAFYRRVVPSRP